MAKFAMNAISFLTRHSIYSALNVISEAVGVACRLRSLTILLGGPLALLPATTWAAPVGGQISAGIGRIAQNENTTTVTQDSTRLAINWSSFNVGANESVRFNQPGRSAIVLNRVLGQSPSAIHGKVSANGQVFILNPNGVLFSSNSQVSVGGLVASTLNLSDTDFMNGRYVFSGSGRAGARIINQGKITADDGGYIALLGPQVANHGTLTANGGNVTLAAGTQMTLTLHEHSLVTLSIEQGAVDALVENHNLIQADGGVVVLTSKGKDAALSGVVNNTGVIQARTVNKKKGEIRLLAEGGTVVMPGTLDASANDGGDGGTIVTAGDKVSIADSAHVTTAATKGKTGTWQIDTQANDFRIANDGGDVSADTLSRMLGLNNVKVSTQAADSDIVLRDALNWKTDAVLSLKAQRNILLDAPVDAAAGGLALHAGKEIRPSAAVNVRNFTLDGGNWVQKNATLVAFNALDFRLNAGSFLRVGDGDGSRGNAYQITDIYGLQGIRSSSELLSGNYKLINDIDAGSTAGWHDGAGFVPIGDGYRNAEWGNDKGYEPAGDSHGAFSGTVDGQGYVVKNLRINRPRQISVGMFGFVDGGEISNIGMEGGSVTGAAEVGSLVGSLWRGTVSDSFSSASAAGSDHALKKAGFRNNFIGGLAGGVYRQGNIRKSHASGAVSGNGGVGGLAGVNDGKIENSHASGRVDGKQHVGGLAGVLVGQIHGSHASGAVNGDTNVGGLVGISRASRKRPEANENGRQISHSYATGSVNGNTNVGGLVGAIQDGARISNIRVDGSVGGSKSVGRLVGAVDAGGAAIGNVQPPAAGPDAARQLPDIGFVAPLAEAPPTGASAPAVPGIRDVIDAVRTARWSDLKGVAPPAAVADLITVSDERAATLALDENFQPCERRQGDLSRACN